jgi:toxin CcdB
MSSSAFSVFENTNPASRRLYPFLVDLQSALLADVLATRLVAPIAKTTFIKRPIAGLTPVVRFQGSDYVVDIPQMAAVIKKTLGPPIGSLETYRDDLIRAVDRLITGN